jgi:hypothetical protein
MPPKNGNKKKEKEINMKATLIGVRERLERLEKIRALKEEELQKKNDKPVIGVELIYNITKKQNEKLLVDLDKEFKSKFSFNTDLQKEFIKPPYLTPEIINHKMTKLFNQT